MFDLSKIGTDAFKAPKKPEWFEGRAVLHITESHVILSNEACKSLNLGDSSFITFTIKNKEVCLLNVDGFSIESKNKIKLSQPKLGDLKKARTGRNKKLISDLTNPMKFNLCEGSYLLKCFSDNEFKWATLTLMGLCDDEIMSSTDTNISDGSTENLAQLEADATISLNMESTNSL